MHEVHTASFDENFDCDTENFVVLVYIKARPEILVTVAMDTFQVVGDSWMQDEKMES